MSEFIQRNSPISEDEILAAKKVLEDPTFNPTQQLEIEDAYLAEQKKHPIIEPTPEQMPEITVALPQNPSEADDPDF